MNAHLLDGLERERAEVAETLRAETAQILTTVLLGLAAAEETDSLDELRALLRELRQMVRADLERVQQLAARIRPSVLDDFGLEAAVRATSRLLGEQTSATIEIDCPRAPAGLSRRQEASAFRIVEEAVRNAIRHSGARRIVIGLAQKDGETLIEIRDDGSGFDLETHEKAGSGFGLGLMQAQAGLLGGSLEVTSQPGAGTLVQLRLLIEGEVHD